MRKSRFMEQQIIGVLRGRLRNECLNQTVITSRSQARAVLAA